MKLKDVDTLFLRIFLLLVAAFLVSSLLAFEAFRATAPEPPPGWNGPHDDAAHGEPLGGPAARQPLVAGKAPAAPAAAGHGLGVPLAAGNGLAVPLPPPGNVPTDDRRSRDPHDPGHPPWISIGLDVAIKVLACAVAAWLAARALSLPMRRLSDAARLLGQSMSPSTNVGIAVAPPQLDDLHGTREVRETAQVFNDIARQLKTDFDSQRLLLATVSHDLRTPLTRLRLRLAELEQHPAARRAIDDVHQMDALIESLLALLRPSAGMPTGSEQRIDAFVLVQAIIDDLPPGPVVSVQGEPSPTRCAPAALRRMTENLIENAIRHGGQSHGIDVRVWSTPTLLSIEIADRGPGLAAEQLANAGTPFLRWADAEDDDSSRRAGLGLGLYITRALAERQGGGLSLRAREGGGLVATLELPAAPRAC